MRRLDLSLISLGVLTSSISAGESAASTLNIQNTPAFKTYAKPIYHHSLFRHRYGTGENDPKSEGSIVGQGLVLEQPSSIISELQESESSSSDQVSSTEDFTSGHSVSYLENPVPLVNPPENDSPDGIAMHASALEVKDSTPCAFFQHSILGADFGQTTFPRISFVASDEMPYRVHYAPGDELHYESYKWPFAACNRACELQALTIRALFDRELAPENLDTALDPITKQTLLLSREICQWKNARRLFRLPQIEAYHLTKRNEGSREEETKLPSQANVVYLSHEARLAMQEIRGILESAFNPDDLRQMFHTVIAACQIHRYTLSPMQDLTLSTQDRMVQQAMVQVERVFADTQGRINVWETRDAIVRATQIYRYQEEQSRQG
jgi:hypothetical protein